MGSVGDLRAMFLSEFGAMLTKVRDGYRLTLLDPARAPEAVHQAGEFCHRMAGVAGMVGYPLAGEIGALCEGLILLRERSGNVDVDALVANALETLDRFFTIETQTNAATPLTPPLATVPESDPDRPRRQSRRH